MCGNLLMRWFHLYKYIDNHPHPSKTHYFFLLIHMDLTFGDLDELIVSPKDRSILGPLPEYTPKQETPGWFHDYINNYDSIQDIMNEHYGPIYYKNAIEYDYYCGQLERVVQRGQSLLNYIKGNQSNKESNSGWSNTREILEILCCAGIRMKQSKLVREYCEELEQQIIHEPGIKLVLGKSFIYLEEYEKAISYYLQYLTLRSQDYIVWKQIGLCCTKLALKKQCLCWCKLAYDCYEYALNIIRKSMNDTHIRYQREHESITSILNTLRDKFDSLTEIDIDHQVLKSVRDALEREQQSKIHTIVTESVRDL
jgi:tetratricopeptide (TPR) repeat protein